MVGGQFSGVGKCLGFRLQRWLVNTPGTLDSATSDVTRQQQQQQQQTAVGLALTSPQASAALVPAGVVSSCRVSRSSFV